MSGGLDYETLAQAIDATRETVRALVVGLMADGFSDSEARDIVAGLFRNLRRTDEDEEEDES